MRERASATSFSRPGTSGNSGLGEEVEVAVLAFGIFVPVGLEGVEQWFMVGVNHDLGSLSVVSKVLDA